MASGIDLSAGLKAEAAERSTGNPLQGHAGLLGSAVSFADIASQAGRRDIFPGVLSTPAFREHVVNGELIGSGSAVLAALVVTMENVATGQWELPKRHMNVLTQADHGGKVRPAANFPTEIKLQALSFSLQHHHHGSAPGGDVQRLVGRIENENLAHASFHY